MSLQTTAYQFIVINSLTLYYTLLVLVMMLFKFLKNPFADPWSVKLKLEPPVCLSDPKYGVHKYIKVNNIKLHYVESGDPSKQLMIFLHGFPEFWYSWRHQIVDFNKDYWCIAVDMRGFADSEKPESVSSYHIDVLVEDVRDLIRKLGREKCILVSHDWGGLVACRFRDTHADHVTALVMLAAPSRESWFKQIWINPKQRKMSWYTFFYRIRDLPEKFLQMNDLDVFSVFLTPNGDSLTKQDIECLKYWFRKQYAFTPPVNYYRANISHVLPEKPRCYRKVPFLYALGAKDPYLHKNLIDEIKKEYDQVDTVLLDNCKHFMQEEDPKIINKLIRDFLQKYNI